LICRLFASAAIRDKNGKFSVYACTYMKSAYPENFLKTNEQINTGMTVPVVSDYYFRIRFIDSQMADDYNPINVSIRKAIEKVAYYYACKPPKKGKLTVNLQPDKELIFMPEQSLNLPDLLPELQFQTSRSSGPGGQNVNKVNSRVEVRFDIPNSVLLTDDQKQLLVSKLASKVTSEGVLFVVSQKDRSQLVNKEDAVRKINLLVAKALTPAKPRRRTKPTAGSVEKRLAEKKIKAQTKQNRQRIEE
jgi:ribosome-associated protein